MRRGTCAAALGAVAVAACGAPSADLFSVERAGSIPGAELRLVVNDGGTVRCDDDDAVALGDGQLLEARELARDLEEPVERRLALAPGPGSILRYRVTTEDGAVRFADTSRARPAVLDRLAFFVRRVARERCGLRR